MLRGGFLAFAFLLGCSPSSGEIVAPSGSNSGGTGGTDPGVGGESGAPSEPTGGSAGSSAGAGGTAGSTGGASGSAGAGGVSGASGSAGSAGSDSGGSGGEGSSDWPTCSETKACNSGWASGWEGLSITSCREGLCSFDCREWVNGVYVLSASLQGGCESIGGTCSSEAPQCAPE